MRKCNLLAGISMAALGFSSLASAAPYTWTGSGDATSWINSANWNPSTDYPHISSAGTGQIDYAFMVNGPAAVSTTGLLSTDRVGKLYISGTSNDVTFSGDALRIDNAVDANRHSVLSVNTPTRTVTFNNVLGLRASNFNLDVYNGSKVMIGNQVQTSGGTAGTPFVLFNHGGTLELSGSGSMVAGTGNAVLKVGYGNVIFDNTTTNNVDRYGNATDLYLGNGTLTLKGNSSATTTEQIKNIRMDDALTPAGVAYIDIRHGTGQDAVLELSGANPPFLPSGNPTYTGTGIVIIKGTDLGAASGNRSVLRITTITTATATPSNKILGTTAFVQDATGYVDLAAYDWGATAGTRGVIPLDRTGQPTAINSVSAASHVTVGTAQTVTAARETGSLKFTTGGSLNLGGFTLKDRYGILHYGDDGATISNGTIQNEAGTGYAGLVVYAAEDLNITANIVSNGLTKAGAGKLSLSGTLTKFSVGGAGFHVRFAEGSLDYTSASDASLYGPGTSIAGTAAQTLHKGGVGTLTLKSFMNSTGSVLVDGGVLAVDLPDPTVLTHVDLPSLGSGNITVNGTGKLWYDESTTLANRIGGDGGSLIFNSAVNGSGTAKAVTLTGTVAPGNSVGTLNVTGNITLGGTFEAEVQDATADLLNVTGSVVLGGTLDVAALSPAPSLTEYKIIDAAGGITGSFATNLDAGTWSVELRDGNTEAWVVVPEPASLGLIGMAGVGILARRRRRN